MASQQPNIPNEVRSTSHGRGGAGNINSNPVKTTAADDLQTPIIKQSTYTTGRGGSGNMAHSSTPEEARKAQDVEAPAHHQSDPKGTYHWGRGGEGNMMTIGKDAKDEKNGNGKERTGSFQNALEKGKGMLGLKGKDGKGGEKNGNGSGSAIADD